MLLGERVEVLVEIQKRITNFAGRPFYEASLVSDDGQTLHIYDGQLKEVDCEELEIGSRYKLFFSPFVNNRWIEFKISAIEKQTPESR